MAIRVGVLGGGYWGKNVIRNLRRMEDVEVVLLCDPYEGARREALELFPGIEVTPDPEVLFGDPRVDAVAVITPPSLHASPAKKALEAGKHVFVEKPMAMSYEEGRELVELARKDGRVLFVDETFLYDPALHVVKDLLDGGAIGRVHHVLLERLGMGRIRCESNVWWNSAPHDLSILRFLIPRPVRSISVRGHSFLEGRLEDVAFGTLELEGGVSAWVHLSWCHPISTASLVAVGDRGAVFYEGRFKKRKVVLYRYEIGERPKELVWGVPSPNFIPARCLQEREYTDFGPTEPLYASLEAFIQAIRDGRDAPSLGKYSLETLKVLDAGDRSMREGGTKIDL
ncbi:MAG TPA: Gfo/Idh/MocA family oxidoreductase [Deltaproteobacteria bacterium]|nr:Gfo/Idh/MocA family oxidoreductase [Deltaproteobacteria bacterium]